LEQDERWYGEKLGVAREKLEKGYERKFGEEGQKKAEEIAAYHARIGLVLIMVVGCKVVYFPP
jgi:hypothetical protein